MSLEVLRFQMRLAKDLQCLKVESYAFAAKSMDEIGRLVGGWLRRSQDPNAPLGASLPSPRDTQSVPACRINWNRERPCLGVEVNSEVAKVRRYTEKR